MLGTTHRGGSITRASKALHRPTGTVNLSNLQNYAADGALLVRENPLATTHLATVTHLSGLDIDSRSEKANKPPKTSQPASLHMITPAAVL